MILKNVIVTGASGPLGTVLINECIKNKIGVLAIVRPGSRRISNIALQENVKVAECNLCNIDELDLHTKYDCCFHLGWMYTDKTVRDNYANQAENVVATLKVAEFAKKMGCETFIGTGSQAEYGYFNGIANEETETKPTTPYGLAKCSAREMLMQYGKKNGLRIEWVRVFSVYGPYENSYVLTSYVIRSLLQRKKPLLTQCEQQWDYLYSDDVARAFLLVGENAKDSGVYCLGSGKTRKIREYVEIIRQNIDPSLPIGIGEVPYSKEQIMHLQADISKIRSEVGFEPRVEFEEGIRRTIEWHKQEIMNEG